MATHVYTLKQMVDNFLSCCTLEALLQHSFGPHGRCCPYAACCSSIHEMVARLLTHATGLIKHSCVIVGSEEEEKK